MSAGELHDRDVEIPPDHFGVTGDFLFALVFSPILSIL